MRNAFQVSATILMAFMVLPASGLQSTVEVCMAGVIGTAESCSGAVQSSGVLSARHAAAALNMLGTLVVCMTPSQRDRLRMALHLAGA
mmetsp:Transcript_71370/g.126091  ORF Transcript_71370/g.126091 Transcript_71370/m.126091 type:complete len:88 (+) Transcript_71370:208-471(+)